MQLQPYPLQSYIDVGAPLNSDLRYHIDVFAIFGGQLWFSGWLYDVRAIAALELRSSAVATGRYRLSTYRTLPSPDVAAQHGPAAASVRFSETLAITPASSALEGSHLAVLYQDGSVVGIGDLLGDPLDPAFTITDRFVAMLQAVEPGQLLEVGSRARSGIVRRDLVPRTWDYTGLDVMAGPNVDIIGDAHELSSLFEPRRFQAVMAFSVLEHLLMPWKFAIELNRVLAVGAVGLFTTHQCWPLHDGPWDFWRFSDRAWDGLFNHATGFEIVEATMGEPAYVVARRCHAATNFGLQEAGFLASNVLFRKVGETALAWPVGLGDVISTRYPGGIVGSAT